MGSLEAAAGEFDPELSINRVGEELVAPLTFIVPQAGKPRIDSAALTGAAPKEHFETASRPVIVRDMRPHQNRFSLDREGFCLRRHATRVEDLYNDEAVRERYDAEIDGLLRRETGADRVFVFDHTRRSDAGSGALNADGARGPAGRVHVDYTVGSGPMRAADVLGAQELHRVLDGGGRIVQLNVWRPITGPVRRSPIALADAGSILPGELIATDHVFPDRVGEIYHVAWGPGQRWYWAPSMEHDEVLLIKGWDSLDDGRARFTPHSSLVLPNQSDDAPPRESIEARTFVVFDR